MAAAEEIDPIQCLLMTRGDVAGVNTRIIKSGRKARDIAVIRGRIIRKIEIKVRDANRQRNLSQQNIIR